MDSTSYLEYARLPATPGAETVTPLHVYENPSYPVASFAVDESTYFVFGGAVGSPALAGLYLHGPLEAE